MDEAKNDARKLRCFKWSERANKVIESFSIFIKLWLFQCVAILMHWLLQLFRFVNAELHKNEQERCKLGPDYFWTSNWSAMVEQQWTSNSGPGTSMPIRANCSTNTPIISDLRHRQEGISAHNVHSLKSSVSSLATYPFWLGMTNHWPSDVEQCWKCFLLKLTEDDLKLLPGPAAGRFCCCCQWKWNKKGENLAEN